VGTSATLSATATSGLPATFSSATPAVCTVSQNRLPSSPPEPAPSGHRNSVIQRPRRLHRSTKF
jgi:hypothetical protein